MLCRHDVSPSIFSSDLFILGSAIQGSPVCIYKQVPINLVLCNGLQDWVNAVRYDWSGNKGESSAGVPFTNSRKKWSEGRRADKACDRQFEG